MKRTLLMFFTVFIGFSFIGCNESNNTTTTTTSIITETCDDGYSYNIFSSQCELDDFELGIEDNDTFYQLLVYSFNDSNGDGVGDFKGIAEKVDYFKYLGVEAIWLSPIHPSPSYHHYDVTDYYSADPLYEVDGFTFEDMMQVLNDNGIDVILDMVVNHSSNHHPYFLEALNAFKNGTQSEYIDYYIFDDEPFTHPTLGYDSAQQSGVYFDAFYGFSGMPAFNYDNPEVKEMFVDVFSFWLDKGVAGFRLDASRHIYDDIELNEAVFEYFVTELEKDYDDVYFVNEIWSSEDEIVAYYESTMRNFNFQLATEIWEAFNGDMSFGYYLQHFQERIRSMSEDSVEANFVSNHDRGRFGIHYTIEQQKLIAAMNILTPGNSYVFYGDEISLTGEYSINGSGWLDSVHRTPMLWNSSTDPVAHYILDNVSYMNSCLSTSNYNVEDEINNPNSLLNIYKTLIELKEELPVFSTGTLEAVDLNENIISYQIYSEDQNILVIHNLMDISYDVDNTNMTNILGFVSQTEDPVLGTSSLTVPALSSIVIELSEKLPEGQGSQYPEGAYIYGTFNNWQQDTNYIMSNDNGIYIILLSITEQSEFKVVLDDVYYGYDAIVSGAELATESGEYSDISLPPNDYVIIFSEGEISIRLYTNTFLYGTFNYWEPDLDYMMVEDNGVYTITIDISGSEEFKVVQNSVYYGYDSIVSGIELVSEGAEYGNIVIESGSYIITFDNGEITIESAGKITI